MKHSQDDAARWAVEKQRLSSMADVRVGLGAVDRMGSTVRGDRLSRSRKQYSHSHTHTHAIHFTACAILVLINTNTAAATATATQP